MLLQTQRLIKGNTTHMPWFSIVITLIVGFIPGFLFGVYSAVGVLSRHKIQDVEEKNSIQHFLLEEADDMFYLFRKDTGEFFCQASSLAELAKEVSTRNIDVAYVVSAAEGNYETYWFRNGEIKTHTQQPN